MPLIVQRSRCSIDRWDKINIDLSCQHNHYQCSLNKLFLLLMCMWHILVSTHYRRQHRDQRSNLQDTYTSHYWSLQTRSSWYSCPVLNFDMKLMTHDIQHIPTEPLNPSMYLFCILTYQGMYKSVRWDCNRWDIRFLMGLHKLHNQYIKLSLMLH